MNIESRWRLLAFWSAKDVPQVHWRRIQVMLMKIQASKPRNRCCTGAVQQDQSTGGQTSRLEVSQELCAQVCTGISRLTAQCSRLEARIGRLGHKPVDLWQGSVDWGLRPVDWWKDQSTGGQTSRLVTHQGSSTCCSTHVIGR